MGKMIIFVMPFLLSWPGHAQKSTNSNLYTEVLPKVFCQDSEYFVSCFDGVRKSCNGDIKSLAADCYEKIKVELKDFQNSMTTERYALMENTKVGFCVGVEYEKKHADKKKGDSKCFSQKGW